jgi:hypothetical protein
MFYGIAGGKRATVFFLPVIFLLLLAVYNYKIFLRPKIFISAFFIISIFTYTTVRLLPTLNPDKEVGGRFSLEYLFKYTNEYNTAETKSMGAIGRVSALNTALDIVSKKGAINFLFGNGPGTLTKTSITGFDNRNVVKEEYNIGYGVTAFIYLFIQSGVLGALFYLLFILSLGRYSWILYKIENDVFWRAFHLGTIGLVFSISFIAYFYDVIHKEPIIMVYASTLIGISISRFHNFNKDQELNESINKYT